jgi:polar amino acid transport system substrate-binding protein
MRQVFFAVIVLIASSIPTTSMAQQAIISELVPTGTLRVGMNSQTPALFLADERVIHGVAVALGQFIAAKLGVPLELIPYSNSTAFTQSYGIGDWDIGFGQRTPLVADKAEFIVDILLTDLLFIAAPGREFADTAQVDRPGVKIGVGTNSSLDHLISRTLKSAEIVRLPVGVQPIAAMRSGQVHLLVASAGYIQQLAQTLPGAKIVPGVFTSDPTMVILPKGRSSAAEGKITDIINEAKKTGVLRKALEKTGFNSIRPAP